METVRRLAAYVASAREEALADDLREAACRAVLDLVAAALDLDDGHRVAQTLHRA
ncbi:hypothetical protein [Bosea sp. (in: a-proteobacteria)]|jgi:2-methylcitrate dehydratase PrpD|uniref:hypothetical protein n=1 Tax=Bosea sp. (in: a-proteobacteria) TaxID=1871050 RepID=UPI002DDCEC41|nr:hypothetical protein [Bosea sp. (in: a-proteobacteria)]HEV2508604.1 hypothetical protein [Bosea sp. (in: a-proteobacteria)]